MSESTKPKPEVKGGGLFDGDDEDDLFTSTTSKPSTAPTTQGMLTQNDCSVQRPTQNCIFQAQLRQLSQESLIVWVDVVLKRTVVVDSD